MDLQLRSVQPKHAPNSLTPRQQFWWGTLGGLVILFLKALDYAKSLPLDAPWPTWGFKSCLLGIVWIAFPFVSGSLSRMKDPHHRLIAAFEGASVSALFIVLAHDIPL